MYRRKYNIALSNIGRTGTEVGRHLGDNLTTTSHQPANCQLSTQTVLIPMAIFTLNPAPGQLGIVY